MNRLIKLLLTIDDIGKQKLSVVKFVNVSTLESPPFTIHEAIVYQAAADATRHTHHNSRNTH